MAPGAPTLRLRATTRASAGCALLLLCILLAYMAHDEPSRPVTQVGTLRGPGCGHEPTFEGGADTTPMFSFAWLVTLIFRARVAFLPPGNGCHRQFPATGSLVLPARCFPHDGASFFAKWRENGTERCIRCDLGDATIQRTYGSECVLRRWRVLARPPRCDFAPSADAGTGSSPADPECEVPCPALALGSLHYGLEFLPRFQANASRRAAVAAFGPDVGERLHRAASAAAVAQASPAADPSARAADGPLTPMASRLMQAGSAPGYAAPPSFLLILFDAAPKWVVEGGLRSLWRSLRACQPSPAAAVWQPLRFDHHNTVALNTFPNVLSLLSGYRPPQQRARAHRMDEAAARAGAGGGAGSGEGETEVNLEDVYACTPALRDSVFCSGPVADRPRQVLNASEPLHHVLAASHVRAHNAMWDSPTSDAPYGFLAHRASRLTGDARYLADHFPIGPFPRPSGYGADKCTHPAIRRLADRWRRCVGRTRVQDVWADYATRWEALYRHVPTFAFDIVYDTHDWWDSVREANPLLQARLQALARRAGPLKDTFVIITSDHGPHNSHFHRTRVHNHIALWILAPKAFRRRFPAEAAVLRRHTRRPTQHRDLYWTIRDLSALYTGQAQPDVPQGARSLIREGGDEPRQCRDAGIVAAFCSWPNQRDGIE